jgi:hypothetical protein
MTEGGRGGWRSPEAARTDEAPGRGRDEWFHAVVAEEAFCVSGVGLEHYV